MKSRNYSRAGRSEQITLVEAMRRAERRILAERRKELEDCEFRAEAAQIDERPKSYVGAAIVITLWIGAALLILWLLWPRHAE